MRKNEEITELINNALEGNSEGLAEACIPYVRAILSNKIPEQDIDDVAQDTICRMIVKIEQISENDGKFKGWLAKLTHNVANDYWRQKYRNDKEPMPKFTDDVKSCQDKRTPDVILMEKEFHAQLEIAIKTLPEEQRLTVLLYYAKGLSTEEIASIIQKPNGTIRRLMHNARNTLRTKFKKKD